MANPTLGTATLRTSLDASGLNQGLSQARGQTNQTFNTLDQRMRQTGQRMEGFGRRMSLFVTAPIVGLGVAAVRTAGQFEQSMNRVRAITGATGDDFERLRGLAADLGETTQFSASEAADGMGFLAQAGFEVDEIMSALPGTLELAAAGQLDLARAADLASNVLSGFGLEASEIGRVNDTLAATASSANTSVQQLGKAMSFAAPVAAGMGVSVEEASAAVGLLSNAGIQGERAGTALRGILGQLSQKSDELGISMRDAQGNMLPVVQILEQLEAQGFTAQDAIEAVGLEAGPALQALLSQGSDALRELTGELENAEGTAGRMAETQMEGLNGQLRELRSAAEGLAIAVGDAGLLDAVTNLAEGATTLVRRFGELDESTQQWIVRITAGVAVIGPLAIGIGRVVTLLPQLRAGLVGLQPIMRTMFGPAGLVVAGAAAMGAFAARTVQATNALNQFANEGVQVQGLSEEAAGIMEQIRALQEARRDFIMRQANRRLEEGLSLDEARAAVQRYDEQIAALRERFDEVVRAAADARGEAESLGDAGVPEIEVPEIEIPGVEGATGGGGLGAFGLDDRTPADVFSDLAEAGTRAERRAAAFGNTLDERLQSVETRAGLVSRAIDELFELGLGAADDRVQFLVGRLEELERQARILRREPATPAPGLLQGGPGNVPGTLAPPPVQVDESEIQAVLDRIVRQAALDASAELQSRLAQQQGAPGAVQTADDLAAFNEELRDRATAEAEVAGALTEYEQEVRAAVAGVATFNARLADIEATRVVVDRIPAQARISADPTLQARLGQQQGGPGAIQTTEGLAAFNEELRARAAQEAEAAGALTTYEQEVRNAAAGAIEFNEGLLEIEAREDAERRAREEVERLTRNFERLNRIASDPNLQARLAQQQGGPLPEGFATPEVEGTTTPEFEQTRLEQGITPEERQRIEEGGIEASRKAAEIEQESAEKQRQAGLDFAESVINAGDTFLGAIQSFQGGDIGGGIAGLGQTAGSLISSIGSLAGSASLFGPIGSLVGAGAGLLGGIISAFTGDDDRQRQREEARARSRSVPAININFSVQQDIDLHGGPQQPQVEQALRRHATVIIDEFMNRTRIVQRIEALEGSA